MSDILLEKRKIGNCEIKNPVMGAPLNMRPYGQTDGMATENHFRLYKEYGKSGLGIIISDAVNVSEECQIYRPALGCWAGQSNSWLAYTGAEFAKGTYPCHFAAGA